MAERVTVAYPFGTFEGEFVASLVRLVKYDLEFGPGHLAHPDCLMAVQTTNLPSGRNNIVRAFLEGESEWLLFIDTDQTFPPNLIDLMVESADKDERPILSALVMALRDGGDITPAAVVFDPDRPGQTVRPNYVPAERHWRVAAVGCGCLLIHRTVLEAMAKKYADSPWPWFEYGRWDRPDPDNPGQTIPDAMGEDYTFCFKAWGAGEFPCYVDTAIEVGHIKPVDFGTRELYAQKPHALAPETFVCIPTKDNEQGCRDLVAQLKEQGGYSAVFIYDNGATGTFRRWLREQGVAEVFPATSLTIGEMWNAAAAEAAARSRRWCMVYLNDDVRIGDDFLPTLTSAVYASDAIVAASPNYDGRAGEGVEPIEGIYAGGNGTGLSGFAFAVKGELFTLSHFTFPASWWFTDNYLAMAITAMGGLQVMAYGTTVEHLDGGSQTIGAADEYVKTPQYEADWAEFKRHTMDTLGIGVEVSS